MTLRFRQHLPYIWLYPTILWYRLQRRLSFRYDTQIRHSSYKANVMGSCHRGQSMTHSYHYLVLGLVNLVG